MSSSELTPVEDMERAELEDEVRDLRDRLDTFETELEKKAQETALRVSMARLAEAITGEEADYSEDPFQHADSVVTAFEDLREELAEFQEFRATYGEEKARDQDEAWFQAVRAATNLENNPTNNIKNTSEVALYIGNLEQATGYSDRHCSNLIETWGEEKEGTRWEAYEAASAGNNHNETKKHIAIDLDVWGDRL